MIRVNLLPRSRATVRAFGIACDLDHLRHAGAGVALVAVTACGTYGFESLRMERLAASAAAAEATLAAEAPRRREAQRVAFDLARLEATARRAADLHRSGFDAASTVARVGDAIPADVYLDDVTSDRGTIRLRGQSASLDRIGEAVTALGRAFPLLRTNLGDVTDRGDGGGDPLTFTAQVAPPPPLAAAADRHAPASLVTAP